MLTLRGVNQYYGESHTLRDVSLSVDAGQILCLMGRNGVGKSTLLQTVMGLLACRGGDIDLDGQSIGSLATERRVELGLGYVPQGRMIFPDLSVEENLRVALAGRKDRGAQIPDSIFGYFPVLAEMRDRRGGDLSGGQQQQLAIGRALVLQPRVLLLDEPGEGIQPNIVQLIGEVLRALRDQGMAILLVEQKLPFARAFADEFQIMDRGQIAARGIMTELSEELVGEYLSV